MDYQGKTVTINGVNVPKVRYIYICTVEDSKCNLSCHYCCSKSHTNLPSRNVPFKYTISHIAKVFLPERLGGVCFFNVTSRGETLIKSEVMEVFRELLNQGHYVSFITNGTLTKRFEEMCAWPQDIRERVFLKFSFPYNELKRLKILDRYFDNIRMVRKHDISISCELVPNDENEKDIPEIMRITKENLGAYCHLTVPRNDDISLKKELMSRHSLKEFYDIWKVFDSELFEFKCRVWGRKITEFCYAGANIITLNLSTGIAESCYRQAARYNYFKNIRKRLPHFVVGRRCAVPHCYNGHVFLTWGNVPEIEAPTYAQVRNRVCDDGSEWLTQQMKAFLSQKVDTDLSGKRLASPPQWLVTYIYGGVNVIKNRISLLVARLKAKRKAKKTVGGKKQ